ncbi:hypothetical protein [Scytonema sp. PCC 10023]
MDMSPNAPKISDGARFLRHNTPYQRPKSLMVRDSYGITHPTNVPNL